MREATTAGRKNPITMGSPIVDGPGGIHTVKRLPASQVRLETALQDQPDHQATKKSGRQEQQAESNRTRTRGLRTSAADGVRPHLPFYAEGRSFQKHEDSRSEEQIATVYN
jgi:hypothetical protein